MRAGILAIGTELLMGQTTNTNATFLSRRLSELGIGVYFHYTVGDNPQRIKSHLNQLMSTCDIVFTTGGLGPTLDDITKEVVADVLGVKMILDDHSFARIKQRFMLYNREMPQSNIRQAYFPEGALILDNDMGTAPACIAKASNGTEIIVLPGPPKELNHIFETHVYPYLSQKNDIQMYSKYLSIYDMGESTVEQKLMHFFVNQSNPTFATYAGDGMVLLRITASGMDALANQRSVDDAVVEVKKIIGRHVVSEEGESIDAVVLRLLKEKNLKIAFAESCTGGKLTAALASNGGASAVLEAGIVTYSNASKMKQLCVKSETLEAYGAVSHQVCAEMVKGLVDTTGVDIGVSITGIAGPTGGTDEKPIGLVYIGLNHAGDVITIENHFSGDREGIQKRVVYKALKVIYDHLVQNNI